MNKKRAHQIIFTVSLVLAALLWIFVYAVPKLNHISQAQERAENLQKERSGIIRSLQDFAATNTDKPNPSPNTAGWITKHTLKGLDKNIESNSPYKNSQGVQIKLRSVTAEQISEILDSMRSVNLIIKTFKIEDPDGDGKWNLEFMAEVPS